MRLNFTGMSMELDAREDSGAASQIRFSRRNSAGFFGLKSIRAEPASEGEAPGLVIFFTRASAACSRNCIFPRVPGPRPFPDNLKYLFSQRNMRLER